MRAGRLHPPRLVRVIYVLLILTPAWCAADLWLAVGEVRTVPAAPGLAVKVGGRGIVRVVEGGARRVRVIGVKPGDATLVIGPDVTHVRVIDANQMTFARELKTTVSTMRGLTLDFAHGRPEIGGTLLRFSDWQLIAELARRRRGEYGFRAQVLSDVGARAITHLTRLARERGYPSVRFRAAPDFTAILPDSASGVKAQVQRGLAAYGIGVDSGPNELSIQPLIRTRVVVAEVSRGFGRTLGVSWPGEYAAQILPRPTIEADLLTSLKALETRGQAQVLATPDLSCRSGGEARVMAGGELPIRTATRQRQGVEWKSFGVSLHVRPRADYQGNISVDLKTEISLVDFGHAVDGIPALKKNVVESQFDLPGRRTVALSGLIRREIGESQDGLPFLSRIPVLGRLFASAQFQRHQSELVVFVTPEIYRPESDQKPELPEGWVADE